MLKKKYTDEEWYSWPYNFINHIPNTEMVNGNGDECPYCHKIGCEHWTGRGWKNPNYIAKYNCCNCGSTGLEKDMISKIFDPPISGNMLGKTCFEILFCPDCKTELIHKYRYGFN